MTLPGRFVVTIEGVAYRVNRRHLLTPGGLVHLLERLLTGKPVAPAAFEAYGCRVTVEPCTDQGCDEGDGMAGDSQATVGEV
jgi:hypothetical protein